MITSAQEFVDLRTSSDPDEYRRAAHEPAPTSVWLEVIKQFPEMREWVAHNKTIPEEVYRALFALNEPRVNSMLATRRACPGDILELLAQSREERIRRSVAINKKTPDAILLRLLSDPWDECAKSAREQLVKRGLLR
jgi:hypothetical protein